MSDTSHCDANKHCSKRNPYWAPEAPVIASVTLSAPTEKFVGAGGGFISLFNG